MRITHKCWCWHGVVPPDEMFIVIGPITGIRNVTDELMRHFGVEPAGHLEAAQELEQAAGDVLLDLGREVLAQHGLLPDHTAASKPGGTVSPSPSATIDRQEK